jgi:O-antigen/teichoic acid export membrane protein
MNLKIDFIFTTFLKVIGEVSLLVFFSLLTKQFGQDLGGVVIQYMSTVMWFGTIAILGAQNVVSKYSSIYFIKQDKSKIQELVIFNHFVLLGVVLLTLPIVLILGVRLTHQTPLYYLLSVTLFCWGSMLIYRELHRATGKIILSEVTFQVLKVALPLLLVIASYRLSWVSIDTILVALIVGLLLIFLMNTILFLFEYRFSLKLNTEWLKELFLQGPAVILRITLERSDVVLLGLLAGPGVAALYAIANRVATIPTLFLDPVRNVLRPRIARAYHASDLANLRRILNIGSLALFASSALVCLVIILVPTEYFKYLGDFDYTHLKTVLLIILVGRVTNTMFGLNGPLLSMTQFHTAHLSSLVVVSSLYFLAIFLLPNKTAIGFAIINSTLWVVLNLTLLVTCKRLLGFTPGLFIFSKSSIVKGFR